VELFAITAVVILLVTLFCFRHAVVDGDSMNATLSDKEHLLVYDLFYSPKQGDIIVFESEEESQLFFSSIPDESCYTKDDYAELHKVIGTLPKKQKLVIVLKFFRDLSVSEVAQILRIPEGTVKSRLHQAKKTIRRRLSNEN